MLVSQYHIVNHERNCSLALKSSIMNMNIFDMNI